MSRPDMLMRHEVELLLGAGDLRKGFELLGSAIQSLDRPVSRYERNRSLAIVLAIILSVMSMSALLITVTSQDWSFGKVCIIGATFVGASSALLAVAWAPSFLHTGNVPPHVHRRLVAIPGGEQFSLLVGKAFSLPEVSSSPALDHYLSQFGNGERTAYDRTGAPLPPSLFMGKLSRWVIAGDVYRRKWAWSSSHVPHASDAYVSPQIVQVIDTVQAVDAAKGDQDPKPSRATAAAAPKAAHFLANGTFAEFKPKCDHFVAEKVRLDLQEHVRIILTIAHYEVVKGEYPRWQAEVLRAVNLKFNGRLPRGLSASSIRKLLNGDYGDRMKEYFV